MAGTQIKGFAELRKKLQTLEKKTARAALRKATTAGTNILLAGVKQTVPRDRGLTAKMIAKKVSTKKLLAFGIVGADVAKMNAAAEREGADKRPSNIDQLLEEGHVMPDGTMVPPTGFMRRAAQNSQGTAERVFLDTLNDEINKAV